ncbi:MAG: MarR family transcriptional regulator [Pseudoruegeria sp.]
MPDSQESLAATLFSELFVVGQMARSQISRALPKGMELSHFSVLNLLAHVRDERSPAQLAATLHVTRGAMTNTLSKLEWAGYVHIRPDWDDARRKFVAISPSGRAALNEAIHAIAPVLQKATSDIGSDRVRATLPVLRELRNHLD